MSEYVGEAFVKITPDARGFNSELDKQIGSQTNRAPLLQRSGIASDLKQMKAEAAELATNKTIIAAAEDKEAAAANRAAQAHENYSVHAHRASIAGFGIRASTVALGAGALIGAEGLHALSDELKVTGAAADTATGSLRNAAAAALTGNFAEAAKNLGNAAGAALNPGASDEAKAANARATQIEKAIATAKDILDLREKLSKTEGQIGTAAGVTRFQLERQLKIAQDTFATFGERTRRTAAGQFGLAPDLGNKVAVAPTDATRESAFGLATLKVQQTKILTDDRALFANRREFLTGQISYLEAAGAHTQAAKDRLSTLYGELANVQSQIESIDAKRIALAETGFAIQLANARTVAQENQALSDQAAFATKQSKDRKTDAETRQGFVLEAAQAEKTIFENNKQEAAKQKELAKQAAAAAKQKYKDSVSVQAEALDAQLQQAQLTERTQVDDKAALRAQIRFYKEEIDDKKLELVDRRNFRAQEIQAEASIAAIEKQHHADVVSIREQKLGIQLQLAQLTKTNLADDKKAIKNQINFYHEQSLDRKNLTEAQRLTARSSEIAAKQSLKDLTPTAPRSSASDFFKEAASQFRTQGSNISTAGGILSGQDARAAFAARALSSGNIATTMAQQAQQTRNAALIEAQKTNVILTTIAHRLTYGGAEREPPAKAIANARRGAHVVQSAT